MLYFRALTGIRTTVDKRFDKLSEDVGSMQEAIRGLQETVRGLQEAAAAAAAPDAPKQSKIPKVLCVSYYCSIVYLSVLCVYKSFHNCNVLIR